MLASLLTRIFRVRRLMLPKYTGRLQLSSQRLNDAPVKFSESAANRTALDSFIPVQSNAPPYQPMCVVLSLAAFLGYFLILREENDVDEFLSSEVYLYVDPCGEAKTLERKIVEARAKGKDTRDLQEKLDKVALLIAQKHGDYSALESSLQRIKLQKEAEDAARKAKKQQKVAGHQ